MLQDFIIPFITILLAELGDKTQLAVLILASKTKKHIQLLAGVFLAFLLADGVAVIAGNYVGDMIPKDIINLIAGILFIGIGIFILMGRKENKKDLRLKHPFLSGFIIILIAELGDKTQIASGLFGMTYNPVLALLAVMAALTFLSIAAIYLGRFIIKHVDQEKFSIVAGVIFLILGIIMLF